MSNATLAPSALSMRTLAVVLALGSCFAACDSAPEASRAHGQTARREGARESARVQRPATAAGAAHQTKRTTQAPPAAPSGRTARACPAQAPAGMACVLGGTFTRGSDDQRPDERPAAAVYVDTFLMDVYEVTNADYAPCIADHTCRRPMPFRGYGGPRQPVVAVSWYDADAFCRRAGKRLPTETEWERAASGPGPTPTRFSWGDEALGCQRSVIKDRRGTGCGRGPTWDVGSFPPGHFGLYDMTGNVWEWVNDWYSGCYDGCTWECGAECFGDNPQGPCGGARQCPRGRGHKVLRGGSWWYGIERSRAQARRGSGAPNMGPHRLGFRCARSL